MDNSTLQVVRALHEADLQHCFAIRRKVFVEEQAVDPGEEYDVYEPTSHHYLAWLQGRPVGTCRCRITPENKLKLERIAVLPEARKRGVGAALVRRMVQDAPQGLPMYMHAQTHALPFYEGLGFVAVGERFEEASIEHLVMVYRG